jgi:hypothetical protein
MSYNNPFFNPVTEIQVAELQVSNLEAETVIFMRAIFQCKKSS